MSFAFLVTPYNETAQTDLSQGKIQAVVVIPENFGESCNSFWETPTDPSNWVNTTVQLYVDSASMVATQAIPPIIQQALRTTIYGDQHIREEPIQLGSPSMVETETLTTFDYFVPFLFAFAAIFLIMTVGQSFATDREKGLLRRINTTPTKATEFMSNQAISNMVTAVLQIIIIFAMTYLMGYRTLGDAANMFMAVVIVLVFSLSCVGFGVITATLAKDPGSATGI